MNEIKIYKAVDKLLDNTVVFVFFTCVGIALIFEGSRGGMFAGLFFLIVFSILAWLKINFVRDRLFSPVAQIEIFEDGIQFYEEQFVPFSDIKQFEFFLNEDNQLILRLLGWNQEQNPCYEIQSLPITVSDLQFLLEKCKQRHDNPASKEKVEREIEPVVKAINEATIGKGFLRCFYFKLLLVAVICLAFYYGFQLYHRNDIKPLTDWSEYGRCYDKEINGNDTLWAYHFAYGVFEADDHAPSVKEDETGSSFSDVEKKAGVSEKYMREVMHRITTEHLKDHGVNVKESSNGSEYEKRSFEEAVTGKDEEGLKAYADALAKQKCLEETEVDAIRQAAHEEAVRMRGDLEREISIGRLCYFMEERSRILLYVAVGSSLLLLILHLARNRSHLKKKRE